MQPFVVAEKTGTHTHNKEDRARHAEPQVHMGLVQRIRIRATVVASS